MFKLGMIKLSDDLAKLFFIVNAHLPEKINQSKQKTYLYILLYILWDESLSKSWYICKIIESNKNVNKCFKNVIQHNATMVNKILQNVNVSYKKQSL